MSSDEDKPRRRPGRPPSDNKMKNIIKEGIVNTPQNPESVIEFYYASPEIFKKLYMLYKNINTNDIIIHFKKTEIVFECTSSLGNSVKTVIQADKCYRYYCVDEISLYMSREASENIINRIDGKYYNSICFNIKEYSIKPMSMIITLFNPYLESASIHEINIQTTDIPEIDEDWNMDAYQLSFNFAKGDFKKYISDIKMLSGELTIIKSVNSALKFKYKTNGGVVVAEDVFRNTAKINLVELTKLPLIATTLSINNILPISNTRISENIKFMIANEKKMMLHITMDDAISTQILIAVKTRD